MSLSKAKILPNRTKGLLSHLQTQWNLQCLHAWIHGNNYAPATINAWPKEILFVAWVAYNAYISTEGLTHFSTRQDCPFFTIHLFIGRLCEKLVETLQSKQFVFGIGVSPIR